MLKKNEESTRKLMVFLNKLELNTHGPRESILTISVSWLVEKEKAEGKRRK